MIRLRSSGWVRWIQSALWVMACGILLALARQVAWACDSSCGGFYYPPSCTVGGFYTGSSFQDCCTWFQGGGHGCCQYTATGLYCYDGSSSGSQASSGTPHQGQYCLGNTCGF